MLGLLCCVDFSLVVESEGYSSCSAWAAHGGDFPCFGVPALGCMGFSSRGCQALERRLSSCGMWA